MEDYYKILNINYGASNIEFKNAYQNKLTELKLLPFMTDNDKNILKNIKKAKIIFDNREYRDIYDKYMQKNLHKNDVRPKETRQNKSYLKQSYIVDRIFDSNINKNNNLVYNDFLKPKNTGLTSDIKPDFDKPLDSSNEIGANIIRPLDSTEPYSFL